jgi:hypothetical protein
MAQPDTEPTATAEGTTPTARTKRNFSSISIKEAMILLGQSDFRPWQIEAPPRSPSDFLTEALKRIDAFNLTNSEAAKVLLIDTLLIEVVPSYPELRVWKAALLESDTLTGRLLDCAQTRVSCRSPPLCRRSQKR